MQQMKKLYDLSGKVPICSLNVDDIVQIGDALIQDISNLREPVRLDISQKDGDIKIEDYHDIIQYDDLMPTFKKAVFHVGSNIYDGGNPVESIHLTIGRYGSRLSVIGFNESWVRGNLGRIQNLLNTKQASIWYRFFRLLYFLIMFFSGSLCYLNLQLAEKGNTFFAASSVLFFVLFVFSAISIPKIVDGDWLPHTAFRSSKKSSIEHVDKIKIILALITLMAAIVTMIFAAIPVFTAIPIKTP